MEGSGVADRGEAPKHQSYKKMEPVQKTDARNPRGFAGVGQGRREGVASAEREENDVAAGSSAGSVRPAVVRNHTVSIRWPSRPDRGAKCKIHGANGPSPRSHIIQKKKLKPTR